MGNNKSKGQIFFEKCQEKRNIYYSLIDPLSWMLQYTKNITSRFSTFVLLSAFQSTLKLFFCLKGQIKLESVYPTNQQAIQNASENRQKLKNLETCLAKKLFIFFRQCWMGEACNVKKTIGQKWSRLIF